MADAEQVIHLTGKEDIHAVRTLLGRAQTRRVLLVVPKAHPAFARLVRLKMLARQAQEEGVQVAVVSPDPEIRALAGQVDLSAFRSVEAGRKARSWREGQAAAASRPNGRTAVPATWARGREAVLVRSQQIGRDSNWGEIVVLSGFIFGVMIVLAAVLLLLVPSAQITLVPQQSALEQTFPVTIDVEAQDIDFANNIVPGDVRVQQLQGTQELATSGRRDVPSATATGRVTFVNVTGNAITIPSGTIVSTSSGSPVRFRTTESVGVPARLNAQAAAPVEAMVPGPIGNVAPLQINQVEGAAAAVVRAFNESAAEGGSVEQRAVVTAADKQQLFDQLRQRLLQEGRAALERALEGEGSELALVPGTIALEITAETYNGSVDDQLDVLNLDLRARVTGIVIAQEDVTRLGNRVLRNSVPDGYLLLEDGFNVISGEAQLDDNGLPIMAVRAAGIAGATLSELDIRAIVRGQPIAEAEAALLQRLPLAADPAIRVTPDWWGRLPYLPIRIFIRVGVLGNEQESEPEAVPGGGAWR